jgi:hypothetical protein
MVYEIESEIGENGGICWSELVTAAERISDPTRGPSGELR